VLWGPSTLEAAARQGVLLTADHRIVDTRRGQVLPAGTPLLQPMTAEEMGALRHWSPEAMAGRIVRQEALQWSSRALLDTVLGQGAQLAPVLGLGMAEDRDLQAPVANAHGVSLEWLRLPPGAGVACHRLAEKQVLIAWQGQVQVAVEVADEPAPVDIALSGGPGGWDSFSVPAGHWRTLRNTGSATALLLVMNAGDARKRIEWAPELQQAAGAAGWALDANGFVAERRFVERAQP
jgi:hypothetical protein